MSKIDLKQLAREIQNLERHQQLYKLLKGELTALGYWRNKSRGNPAKGFRSKITKG